MFTGIIEEKGKIIDIKKGKKATTFRVKAKSVLKKKKIGQSIAVDGACMTITKLGKEYFEFDAMPESLEKTTLGQAKAGTIVNLEPSLKLGQELDGHMVQGHVDSAAKVASTSTKNDRTTITIETPKSIKKLVALKGSISINGVSLTISKLTKTTFSVDLIPITLKKTNLANLKKGDKVNLEVDIIARYLQKICK